MKALARKRSHHRGNWNILYPMITVETGSEKEIGYEKNGHLDGELNKRVPGKHPDLGSDRR